MSQKEYAADNLHNAIMELVQEQIEIYGCSFKVGLQRVCQLLYSLSETLAAVSLHCPDEKK